MAFVGACVMPTRLTTIGPRLARASKINNGVIRHSCFSRRFNQAITSYPITITLKYSSPTPFPNTLPSYGFRRSHCQASYGNSPSSALYPQVSTTILTLYTHSHKRYTRATYVVTLFILFYKLTRTLLAIVFGARSSSSNWLPWDVETVSTCLASAWWHLAWTRDLARYGLHRCWARGWCQILRFVLASRSAMMTRYTYPITSSDTAPVRLQRVPHLLDRLKGARNVHATVAVRAMIAEADLTRP